MRYSDIIKDIQSNVSPTSIANLRLLGNDIDQIKAQIESEATTEGLSYPVDWERECGRRIGIISEYIISLGALLKASFFTNEYGENFALHHWDTINHVTTKVNSILKVTGGSSSGAEVDILLVDEKEDKMCGFSSKMRRMYSAKTLNWGDIEIEKMDCLLHTGCKNIQRGAFIFDHNHLQNFKTKYKDVKIYDWQHIKAIWQQVYSILAKRDFDYDQLDRFINSKKLDLVPYFHQTKAVNAATQYYGNGGEFFLFDHICRSGKTITALQTAKEIHAQNILLLTSFPCINEMEWADTILRFYDFAHWNVVNFSAGSGFYSAAKNNFVMVSFQDLKANDYNGNYGWNKPKFDQIRNQKWDLVIVDEVHYGFETDKSTDIIEGLTFDKCLALSATPFINYFRNTFDATNTNRWTIFDEAERAKVDPVYAAYPKMNFLLFAPPKAVYEEYFKEYTEEDGLTFAKLMRLNGTGEFFYKRDIEILIKYIFGDRDSKYKLKNSPFVSSRDKGQTIGDGIIIFVPKVECCEPLQKLLLENPVVRKIYGDNIHYTYSDTRKSYELKPWLQRVAKPPFIIIAVDQLTTGVTVAGIDTVILMNDGESPQELMQRMFRCRTATKDKRDAYVIDLNPSRTFRMVYEYTTTLAEVDQKTQLEYFKRFFDCVSIVYNDGAKFVDVNKEMEDIFQQAGERYLNYFGKLTLLKNDELSAETVQELEAVYFENGEDDATYKEGIKKGKTSHKDKTDNDDDEDTDKDKKDAGDETDAEKRRRELRLKMLAIMDSLTWASVFTDCQYDRYDEIFNALAGDTKRKQEYDKLIFNNDQTPLSCKRIITLLDREVDGKVLNSIITKFNMDFRSGSKPKKEIVLSTAV